MQAVTSLDVTGLKPFTKGKVRDIYDLGERLLVVASDRLSAFDYVLPSGIPDKGRILTAVSAFWFRHLEHVSRHHMISTGVEDFPEETRKYEGVLRDRSMLVWKARRIDIECIVRGFLAGSAWKEYSATGSVAGHGLPQGLKKNARLDRPLFTPSTKSDEGHDRNITVREMCDLVGSRPAEYIMARSLALFDAARQHTERRGLTLLDTKFEFGYLQDEIILIDEVLTPDSSRYLYSEDAKSEPLSLDKQYVRDYLEGSDWDGESPPPPLPPDVIAECRRRYLVLLKSLTGEGERS
jgi:phosphoribosylaminoimidazole-succinocarboxamide synthase